MEQYTETKEKELVSTGKLSAEAERLYTEMFNKNYFYFSSEENVIYNCYTNAIRDNKPKKAEILWELYEYTINNFY